MKKVLVTGGAGFIGSYIVKELLERGYKPIVFDSFSQYVSPLDKNYEDKRYLRFKDIIDEIIIERGNTSHDAVIQSVLLKHKPSYIIHLAALSVAKMKNLHVYEAMEGAVISTSKIIETIARFNNDGILSVKKFIYTSSSMVYGNFIENSANEEHPTNPINIYGTMKLSGEVITRGLCDMYGLPYNIIRPSAVYGPTDMNNRVSQILLENAIRGNPLIVNGGDEEKLDFSYVKDVAKGFVLAMLSEKANRETFNITSGNACPILEYAQTIKKYFPDAEIVQKPRDESRPKRGTLDINKAKRILGYKPIYDLEKGIKEYVQFISSRRKK